LAFGDESCGEDAVTYALVVIQRHNLPAIEDGIRRVKLDFGSEADSALSTASRPFFAPKAAVVLSAPSPASKGHSAVG